MHKLGIFISVLGAFLPVILVLGVIGYMTPVRTPNLISREESGAAMQQAGVTMQSHGQEMVKEGGRKGSQSLLIQGEHWLKDGQEMGKQGQLRRLIPPLPAVFTRTSAIWPFRVTEHPGHRL
ncbi:MAG: hypothetical protein J0I20_22830 [Chloroflexi bacterium]|nr:hypothetical protein [Chloroflexota bacterium]OJV93017.1 MAG: hypothetical protein BGO39_21120 [Chloroflexi bacterium 54-19]